jgi:TolA-binding protein
MTNCDATPETAERYVSGSMADADQAAFEEHFFACDACFRTVQALQDAQATLAASPAAVQASPTQPSRRALPVTWLALAAMVVLSVIVWRMPRQPEVTVEAPAPSAGATPPAAVRPVDPAPAPAPVATPAPNEDPLTRMAAITPPPYVALTTRSAATADERAFEQAMAHYTSGRYAEAARGLSAVAAREPSLAHVQFFLGISELMDGRTEPARAALQRVVRSGTAPYSDEAHFYLAKAALRLKDVEAARRALRIALDREAGPRGEAAKLLGELKAMPR